MQKLYTSKHQEYRITLIYIPAHDKKRKGEARKRHFPPAHNTYMHLKVSVGVAQHKNEKKKNRNRARIIYRRARRGKLKKKQKKT